MLLSCILMVQAAPVDRQKARQLAEQYMQERGVQLMGEPLLAPGRNHAITSQPVYIFNAAQERGFVVVAGDDCVEPILGYVEQGRYDETRMPEGFREWLTSMAKEVERASWAAECEPRMAKAPKRMPTHNAISPLIKTRWSQGGATETGYIYNTLCPLINGKHAITGCTATAGAQVMYYYQYPKNKTKDVPGYQSNLAVTSEGLPAIKFSWDKMKTIYKSSDAGTESEKAVSELMVYCGYAAHMDYGLSASGGSTSFLAWGMVEYFDYDPYTLKLVDRSSYSVVGWDELIYNELAHQRPVIYSGYGSGGHAFICDGYDGNGYYHFNWGWGGSCDGFFKLQATNPYEGDGSMDIGYCMSQDAVIGLQPNTGVIPSGGNGNLDEWEDVTIEGVVGTASNVVVDGLTVTMRFSNYNDQAYQFAFGMGELNADGSIQVIDTKYDYYQNTSLPVYYGFSNCSFDLSAYDLSEGTHILVPISRLNGESEWKRCRPATVYFEVTVSASGDMTVVAHPLEKIKVDEFAAIGKGVPGQYSQVSVKVTNEGDNFTGYLSLYATKTGEFGSEKDWERLKVKAGNSKEYTMRFVPEEEGTYTLYLCLDENTNKLLATTTMEVVAPTVKVTAFSFPGFKIATLAEKVVATVKSTGNEFSNTLYLFASTTTEKGEFVYANGTAIEADGTEDVTFYFKPNVPGTWNLWVCTDSQGNNVIGHTTVEIESAPTGTVWMTYAGGGGYAGNDMYQAKVYNMSDVNFYMYIRSWISDAADENSETYVQSDNTFIEAKTVQDVFFKADFLEPGHTYKVILNYPADLGCQIWGYLGEFSFTVPAGMPGDVDNDGEVTVQDVSSIVDYILGLQPSPFNIDNADMDGNGSISVSDVTGVVNIILGE